MNISQDIDECIEFKHNCGKESMCTNTLGSYHCKCPEGYVGFIYNYAVECHGKSVTLTVTSKKKMSTEK